MHSSILAGAQRRDWDRGQGMPNDLFGLLCDVVMILSYLMTFYHSLLCFAAHCHIVMANRCQDYKFNFLLCCLCQLVPVRLPLRRLPNRLRQLLRPLRRQGNVPIPRMIALRRSVATKWVPNVSRLKCLSLQKISADSIHVYLCILTCFTFF